MKDFFTVVFGLALLFWFLFSIEYGDRQNKAWDQRCIADGGVPVRSEVCVKHDVVLYRRERR